MRALRTTVVVLGLTALLGTSLASVAAAQEARSITLQASASRVDLGQLVTFSGVITPATAGQTVDLLDEAGTVLTSGLTDAAGAFAFTLTPESDLTVRARWGTVESDPVTVQLRATVAVRMTPVRLFDTVFVRGTVPTGAPGGKIEVRLLRAGEPVATKTPRIRATGDFKVSFRILTPGRYRARAIYVDDAGLRGRAVTSARETPLPSLRQGDRSVFVRLLERRLGELNYRLVGIDRSYDFRTADAVMAFRKVQRMPRVFTVDAAVWRALADPLVPRPRLHINAFHIEVDQTRQVLYTVRGGRVTNVIHVSTGAGGATRDGSFRVYRKLAGYSPNRLYYPSYFDHLRAIHGWTEVPTYPASHGCVRVPYWHAQWIFGLAVVGTRISIYH
jgi:N-acetylmuramoyl-L-alanine amidase